MKLGEKAEQAEQPDVSLARDSAPGFYVLQTDELTQANEITAEDQFPQYGDFLEVGVPNADRVVDRTEFIECPAGLAQWLVEEELEVGDSFRVLDVWKADGSWCYQCRQIEDPDVSQPE